MRLWFVKHLLWCCLGLTGMVLAGCNRSQPIEPQVVTFNYAVRQVPDVSALIASIQGGQTTIADTIGANPCNFTASFAGATPPVIGINGDPGQTGFNISIESLALTNITTTNPAHCQDVSEIAIFIGGLNEALNVGGRTNSTSAEVVVGGTRFSTSRGFLDAGLTGFRTQTRYASGEVRFVGGSTTAGNVLLVDGSYAVR